MKDIEELIIQCLHGIDIGAPYLSESSQQAMHTLISLIQNGQVDGLVVLQSIIQIHGNQGLDMLHSHLKNPYSRPSRVIAAKFIIECTYCNEEAQDYLCETLFGFTPINGLVFLNQSQISRALPIQSRESYADFKLYCSNLIDKYNQEKSKGFYRKYWSYPENQGKNRGKQGTAGVGGGGEQLPDQSEDSDDCEDVEVQSEQRDQQDLITFPDPLDCLIGFYVYSKENQSITKFSQVTDSITGSIRNEYQQDGRTKANTNKAEEVASNLIFSAAGSGSESATNIQKRMKLHPQQDSLSPQRSLHMTTTTYQSYFSRNTTGQVQDTQRSEKVMHANSIKQSTNKHSLPSKKHVNQVGTEQSLSSTIKQQYFTLNTKHPIAGGVSKKQHTINLSGVSKNTSSQISSLERQHYSSADHERERSTSSNPQQVNSNYPSFVNTQSNSSARKGTKQITLATKNKQNPTKQIKSTILNMQQTPEEETKSSITNKETFIGAQNQQPSVQTPNKKVPIGSAALANFPSSILNAHSMNHQNMLTLKHIITKNYKVDKKLDLDSTSPQSHTNPNSMVMSSFGGQGSLSAKSSTAQQITFKAKLGIAQLVKPRTKVQIIKKPNIISSSNNLS